MTFSSQEDSGKAGRTPRRRAARRGGRKSSLTFDDVVSTALRVADRDGLTALTMQRIAAELGVGVMTLYGYVRTKEEIYDGIGTLLLSRLELDPASEASWEEQLADSFTSLRGAVHEHPGAAELLLTPHSLSGVAFDHIGERLLGLMHHAGFKDEPAATAIANLASYTIGFTAVEIAREPAQPDAPLAWPRHMSDKTFTTGLTQLLTGIRMDLEATNRDPTYRL
jgi:AcrR family transcriptional regulator